MDLIEPRYRVALPPELEQELTAAAPMLPVGLLLGILATSAETMLTDTFIGDTVAMFDILQEIEDLTEDERALKAVKEHLPAGLQTKHWAATYKVLQAVESVPLSG